MKFEGKSESVRDVQYNPMVSHDFAAAFETGTIQVIMIITIKKEKKVFICT